MKVNLQIHVVVSHKLALSFSWETQLRHRELHMPGRQISTQASLENVWAWKLEARCSPSGWNRRWGSAGKPACGAGWNMTVEGRWGVGAVGGRCLAWKQETRVLIPALLLSPTCFLGVPHGECEITSSVSVFSKHGSYIFYLNHCHFWLEVTQQFRP